MDHHSSDPSADSPSLQPEISIEAPPPAGSSRLSGRFWRLFGADAVSSLGDGLVMVGFPLLALTLTSNPLLIAAVLIAGRLPALLCSVPAGALADRVDRRRMVVVANIVRIAALALFSAAVIDGHDSLPALYATVFVLGAADMAFSIACQACLPAMVPAADLPRANGYLFTADVSGEQFVGPAIGGLAFAAAPSLPFIGDAVSFALSTILVRRALPEAPRRQESGSFFADVRDGLRWFARHRLLRLLALVVASLAFCQAMIFSELVLYGTHQLRLGHVGYGLFFAGLSAGNVFGSLGADRIHAWLGPARCIIAAAVVAGVAYLVISATSVVALATTVLFLEAVGVSVGNVTTLSLRQRVIPSHLLGRVGSAFRLLLYGLIPLGALASGIITSQLGIRDAFRIAGAVQLVVIVAATPVLVRRLRQIDWVNSPSPV
jgi:MFS family permease